ncbi:MAG TPA: hypothetical protein VN226_04620 [Anaerolineales bacterium]|nr:hypothetical protein [Anaerolineales bacterium]
MLKDFIGQFPSVVRFYDQINGKPPRTRFNLRQLDDYINQHKAELASIPTQPSKGKRVTIFATLHYWIEQAAIIGLVLNKKGYEVTLAYLAFSNWEKPLSKFDLIRQDLYAGRVLSKLDPYFKSVSLLNDAYNKPSKQDEIIRLTASYDTMYTLQVEDFDPTSALYQLRLERNARASGAIQDYLLNNHPDTVLIPNGLVTELAVAFQVAQKAGYAPVTYEFNDQREQIWISQSDVVMNQNTDELWKSRGNQPLPMEAFQEIQAFEFARSSAQKYGKGTRNWQDVGRVGAEQQKKELGLDDRPVTLLATNVLGDSLTLGRNLFTKSMAEWIAQTVKFYAKHPEAQLVVRIHPGERLMKGPSSMDVISRELPDLPENIRVIGPLEKVNTYDLMEAADLGLVYTTTVGLEMAMRGVPVIVAGKTHYRGKGFTFDPNSYDEFFAMNEQQLELPKRLSEKQIELAWRYGYLFFFAYPKPFPWRLMKFWEDLKEWDLTRLLSDDGEKTFGNIFDHLAGKPLDWNNA